MNSRIIIDTCVLLDMILIDRPRHQQTLELFEFLKTEIAIVRTRQAEFNKKVIDAFKTEFDFCPTYFFFSEYSDSIKINHLDKVKFLNENLTPDSKIKFREKSFLTAEFDTLGLGNIENEHSYTLHGTNGQPGTTVSYGGTYTGHEYLIIKDEKFIELSDPFPFEVMTIDSANKASNAIKRMNKKLHDFYESITKK